MKRRIINIDESVINLADSIKRGYLIKAGKNKATTAKRIDQINIIAGISNYGDVFYTINHGMGRCEKKSRNCKINHNIHF